MLCLFVKFIDRRNSKTSSRAQQKKYDKKSLCIFSFLSCHRRIYEFSAISVKARSFLFLFSDRCTSTFTSAFDAIANRSATRESWHKKLEFPSHTCASFAAEKHIKSLESTFFAFVFHRTMLLFLSHRHRIRFLHSQKCKKLLILFFYIYFRGSFSIVLISNRNGECHTSSEAAAGRVQRGVKKNNKIIIGVWTANDDDSQHNVTKIKIYNISQTFQVFSFSPLFPAPPIYFLSRSTPILSRPRFLLNPNPEMADFMCRTRARELSKSLQAAHTKHRIIWLVSSAIMSGRGWRARFWVQQNNSAETFPHAAIRSWF